MRLLCVLGRRGDHFVVGDDVISFVIDGRAIVDIDRRPRHNAARHPTGDGTCGGPGPPVLVGAAPSPTPRATGPITGAVNRKHDCGRRAVAWRTIRRRAGTGWTVVRGALRGRAIARVVSVRGRTHGGNRPCRWTLVDARPLAGRHASWQSGRTILSRRTALQEVRRRIPSRHIAAGTSGRSVEIQVIPQVVARRWSRRPLNISSACIGPTRPRPIGGRAIRSWTIRSRTICGGAVDAWTIGRRTIGRRTINAWTIGVRKVRRGSVRCWAIRCWAIRCRAIDLRGMRHRGP